MDFCGVSGSFNLVVESGCFILTLDLITKLKEGVVRVAHGVRQDNRAGV